MFPQKHKTFSAPYARIHYIVVLCAFLLFSVFAFFSLINTANPRQAVAATSSTLTFQGRLYNASGSVVDDGYYNIEFKIFNASTSAGSSQGSCAGDANCVWVETYYDSNGVTAGNDNRLRVVNGYFSANLGSLSAFGAINWDQEHWISMNIGGPAQTATPTYDGEMTPRIKLTAVPYAFRAGAILDGSGNAYDADDLVQLAPGSVQGASSANALIRLNQTGAGNLLQLQASGSDRFIIENDGDFVAAGDGTVQGGTLTVGTTAQTGDLRLYDGSSNYGSITVASLGQNTVYTLADVGGGTATICLQEIANCAGSGDIVQDGNSFGEAVTIGTNDDYGVNIETNGTTRFSLSNTGAALFQNGTNSATAFQIQNAASASLFTVDTTNAGAITLLGNNNGEITSWTTNATSLPANRFAGGVVTANGYVYVLGGGDGSQIQEEVYYAKLNANGSVGTFASTTSIPNIRSDFQAAYGNGYIYVIAGYQAGTVSTVYYAKVNADGTLGSWQTGANALTSARQDAGTVVANGYIYVIGGSNSGGGSEDTVYYAKLASNGSVGSWSTTSTLAGSRHGISAVSANGYVYVFGGNNGGGAQTSSYYAKINTDGTLGTWASTTALPVAQEFSGATVQNGKVYVIGGRTAGAGTQVATVYYASLNSDGTVGSWSTSTHPVATATHAPYVTSSNGYIYAIGGMDSSSAVLDDVYYTSTARVTVGGNLDLVGLSGENLAEGGTGGSLTAGNGTFVGTLDVQDQARFYDSLYIEGNLNASGSVLFQNAANSTTAFQIQNAAGTNYLVVDTANGKVGIGQAPSSSGQLLQINGAVTATAYQLTSGNVEFTSAGNGSNGITKGAIADNAITANQVVVLTGSNGSNQLKADLTTTARDIRVFGVAANTVAGGSQVNVKILGYATVDVDTSAVAAGDQLVTSTTSGRATVDNTATTGILGYAVSTKAGGSNGTVVASIRPVNGQYSPTFRNASDSTSAFQIQNAAGTSNLLVADTTNSRIGIGKVPTQGALDVNGDVFASNLTTSFTVSVGSTVTLDTASASSGNIRKRETAGTGGVTSGDVVVRASDGKLITTTTPRDPRVYGISVSTLALNAQGSFVIAGNGQVTAKTADAIAIGDQLVTSDVAGAVTADNNATTGILGIALSAKGAGIAGSVNVAVNVHGGQSSPVFRNTSDSTAGFQVQDASGASVLNVETTATNHEVTVGSGSGFAGLAVNGGTSQVRDLYYRTAGSDRFILRVDNTAESGSNAGSNFLIRSYDDSGTYLGTPLTIYRNDGSISLRNTINSANGFNVLQADGSTRLSVDTQDSQGLKIYGNTSDELVEISSSAGLQVRTTGTTAWTNLGTNADGTNIINYYNSGATSVGSISGTGAVQYQNSTNSTSAFQVQNASGSELLLVDTTNNRVYVGDTTGDTTGALLILDTKTDGTDPTGINGGMYYNESLDKFRCYENGAWKDCDTNTAGTVTLDDAYGNGAAGDQIVNLTTTNDSIVIRNPSSSGTDSAYVLTIDQLSTGATGGLSIESAGTGNLLTVRDTTATAVDVLTIADGGSTTFRNQTNSTTAFQIQNATAQALINVNTSNYYVINNGYQTLGNELQNPSFEAGPIGVIGNKGESGWYVATGNGTFNLAANNARSGLNSVNFVANSTGGAFSIMKYFEVQPGESIYTEMYAKSAGGANGDVYICYEFVDENYANPTGNCDAGGTPGTSYELRSLTQTVPAGYYYVAPYVFVDNNATTGTFYFDDFYLKRATEQAPITYQNSSDSTTAFRIQNAAGNQLFNTDSTNSRIEIGDLGTPTGQLYVGGIDPTAAADTITTGDDTGPGRGPDDIAISGNYAYLINYEDDNLEVYDISNPANLVYVGAVNTDSSPEAVAVSGNYAFVANNGPDTLQVIDITNPASLSVVDTITTDTDPINLVTDGQYVYVMNLNGDSIQVFDVSQPADVTLVSTFTSSVLGPRDAYLKGKYLYVANRDAGTIQIVDVSNPASLSSVDTEALGAGGLSPLAISVNGSYAYVSDSTDDIYVFNISNPGTIVEVTNFFSDADIEDLETQGRYLYGISNQGATSKLYTYDISDPSAPVDIANITTGSDPYHFAVQGRYAFVTSYSSDTLASYDIGGAYIQQLEAGGISSTSIDVVDARVSNSLVVGGTFSVAGSAFLQGDLAVLGDSRFNDITLDASANRTIDVATRTSNAAGRGLTIVAGDAGAGGSAFSGGTLTLQGGDAAGTGNANGGSVSISGGAGTGTGVQGLVNLSTTAFSSASTQSFAVSGSLTSGLVDQYATIPVEATADNVTVTIPVPNSGNQVVGRLLYISAVDNSEDFTISLGGTLIEIAMKENSTATLIWNGAGWTAAGASSSTDLQSAYNNTLTSAGGAELVLNPSGGNADGLTIRNNDTTPITGGLLEVQNSIGSNLFTVNNNATEYATNGGAETAGASASTFPSSTWDTTTGGTVDRYTTVGDNIGTGQASVRVQTTTTNHGARDRINATLTSGLTYKVSFAVRGAASFSTLQVLYSPDGTTSGTATCVNGNFVTEGIWTRVSCSFVASGTITSSNSILIRQTDATARTFYIDNLSVTVDASATYAADGSVDSALGSNWTAFGTLDALTRDTSVIYDTSGSVNVDTPNSADRGVRNNLAVTPATSTQYLVTFYARSSNTFNDIRVRYTRDGGTNFVSCVDYNTQTVSTTAFTEITCLFTTDSTTATNPDLIIDQPTGSDRNFYIDALSVTLNTNNSNNVQIGGANKGGPVTLFTLDRSDGAPIASNNEAYLGSMYYDTDTGRIQCYEADGWGACGAAPDNYVNLNPEYAGAVLNATANGASAGVGTMTTDLCSNETGVLEINTSLCSSGESRNYYRWTSPQASQQTYSIYVSYQLPETFNGFASDDTVQLIARADSTSNAAVTYEMFKSTGSALTKCGSGETTVVSSANTWQSVGINGNEATGCSLTSSSAGDFIIFKINLKANSNANAYVSTLSFTTTGR